MATRSPATWQSRRHRPALLGPVLYTSRVLPYRIAYPPGWHADGSISGTTHRLPYTYYDADTFSKRGVAQISVAAEGLPAGVPFTAASYAAALLLDVQRQAEMEPGHGDSGTRLGTIAVGGTRAYLLDVRHGTGGDQLRTTEAVFVAAGRGWTIGLTVLTAPARAALVRVFTRMLGTFQLR